MAEPSPASDADKIRLKRLAKLQQQQERQSTEQQEPVASTSGTTTKPPAPTSRPPVPAARPELVKPAPSAVPAAKAPRIATPQQSQPLRFTDSFEEWQHGCIGRTLNVTLDVAAAEASSWSVVYLKDVAVELDEEDPTSPRPHKLRADLADRLLLSRLSLSPSNLVEDPERITVVAALPQNETSFEYLGSCWRRERTERSRVVAKKDSDPQEVQRRLDVLNQLKGLLVSYIGLVLMDPSMFPQDHVSGKTLGALELEPLLIPSSTSIPPAQLQVGDAPSVLADLALRFTPSAANDFEGGIEEILGPLFAKWNAHLLVNKLDIGGGGAPGSGSLGWRDIVQAVQNLTEIKPIATALTTFSNWNVASEPGASAPVLEYKSLLGPLMRLSSFPDGAPSLPQSYFPEPSTMMRGNIDSASASLRCTLRGVQTSLFRILDNTVRSSPAAREAVLAYLGQTAVLNAKRAAMRADPNTVSTEGFVINLHAVLVRFAEPFMDASFSKIDKIDPLYYKQSSRVDVAEDTKINANKQESDEYYTKDSAASTSVPNFISEIFFLCAQYLHIGPMHAVKEHKGIGQQVSHMQRQLNDMEADSTWRGTPQEAATKAGIERYKKKIEQWRSFVLAYEVQLLDPDYLAKCASFANLVMAWLVRLVDPKKQHPHVRIDLPLPSETPLAFRMLPEFLIEDITEFLSFTSKYAPQVLETSSQDELMSFMLVFLSTPYMKNPYLKGQFVEIMYYLSRPTYTSPRGCLGDVLNFHQLALKNLMPCLIHAYIEIEITGSHTQFYDKFNIRYYITQLFKLVWSNPTHREALKRESQVNFDRYVRFVNLLMNDTTYLLDDALVHLGKIGELQRAMDDQSAWEALPASERQEKEKLLRQYESTVRSDLDLGHESLRLLKLFSQETTQPFLTREIADRLAAMLDANLQLLAGPRCQELKVKEPEKYKFRPKGLLSDVLQIFLNLGPHEQFQAAVAKDGRSYSKELFQRAMRIATKTAIKTEEELKDLSRMVEKVEAIRAAEQEDEAMGEIPDEYLDPLTFEIMEDPVMLPSSHTILDRSTIKQHYLSDATDPFNRQPLKWEDITDAVELREQIEQYLAERRKKKGSAASAGDRMQVDG
ncbi:E4 ubiquitin-protein ligase UFD2 [Rhodotorula toruloides]|uniref:RING-type E3 ubiquitin transferase n=1 Tax=Rhodotorula toruloides TaxID=5286 RepID=A0A0K3CQK8_RHOTO|nr:E4 ubiquitin-protein ligase UFD2 [Rhodotorula toruloides]PRQ70790.1 Ubiquitin elongating factor core-domain containing protein [Rhodotorula toruloides]